MKQPLQGIRIYFLLFLLLFSCTLFAQQDTAKPDSVNIYNMTLEQLVNLKQTGVSSQLEAQINALIGVASKKALSQRSSPSVVTVITQDEIERSGARDLIDVLRLVPGIDFGVDVQGNISIAIRGNWAEEGKVLLLLDGQEMNELMYSTTQFGNHFDVSQIKRIEIIRGPGSAIYGGFAEYGVISIITKDGDDLKGFSATGGYGESARALGYRDVSLSVGDKINDFTYSLAGFVGQANRSDNTYTDFNGASYSMINNSNLNPASIDLKMAYKGLVFTGVYDQFNMTTRDNYGIATSQAYPNNFLSELFELKYNAKLLDGKMTLTPLLSYKSQMPWNFTGTVLPQDSAYTIYDKTVQRYKANLTMLYDVTRHINIVAGTEAFYDYATLGIDTTLFNNGKRSIGYMNTAAYAQVLFHYKIGSLLVGGRFDNNSAYGSSFVPRLGLTKKVETWNFKLLYNNSFRAPGIEDIDFSYNGNIKPEETTVVEFEVGKELTSDMFLTLNFYDITTKNPIVYYVDTVAAANGSVEGYKNMNEQGTRGAELDYRVKQNWGYLDLNYAFYTTAGKTVVPEYQAASGSDMTLGFAANKVNLALSYNITPTTFITPTISWIGQRYGYVYSGVSGYPELKLFSPTTLANIFIMHKYKKLKIGVGCYNILNADYEFIQPYNGGHAPLPSMSREYELRVSYDLNFKK